MSARSPGGGLHGPFVPQLRVVRHVARVQDVVRRSRAPPPPLPPLPRACPVDPPPVADARRSIHPATRRSSPSQTSSKVRVVRPRLVVPSPTTPARIRLFWAVSKLRRDWIFDERRPRGRRASRSLWQRHPVPLPSAHCRDRNGPSRQIDRHVWVFHHGWLRSDRPLLRQARVRQPVSILRTSRGVSLCLASLPP